MVPDERVKELQENADITCIFIIINDCSVRQGMAAGFPRMDEVGVLLFLQW